jgi:iron(III) transport system substrate-binding protein
MNALAVLALATLCVGARAGDITVYTALEEDDVRVYLVAFNKENPNIKVNVLRLSTGDLAARILAEKSNPRHDVIWGWAVTQMVDPRFLEMTEPYKPKGVDKMNPQFKDPEGRWFATTGISPVLRQHRGVEEQPAVPVWQDLLNPVQARSSCPTRRARAPGAQVVSILQEGEKRLAVSEGLDKNIAQYIKWARGHARRPPPALRNRRIFFIQRREADHGGVPIKLVIERGRRLRNRGRRADETSKNKGGPKVFLDWLLRWRREGSTASARK